MRTLEGPALRRAARRIVRRRHIDDPFDRLRFRIDTFPRRGPLRRLAWVDYQPLPWLGLSDAERGEGTLSRWAEIRPWVERTGCGTALDLGCDRGFFAISMACSGLSVIGVEPDPPAQRTALFAMRRMNLANAGVLAMWISPATVDLLPSADAVLFLSLWHHLVLAHGLEHATGMLSAIWERSRKLMFFDTGESEMPPEYGLPAMTPTPREWLAGYLADACHGGEIVHCRTHDAYAPDGARCSRNLFAVIRASAVAVHSEHVRRSEI